LSNTNTYDEDVWSTSIPSGGGGVREQQSGGSKLMESEMRQPEPPPLLNASETQPHPFSFPFIK